MPPSLRSAQNHFILPVGTNDLDSDKTAEKMANTIFDLAPLLKIDQHDVSISNIYLERIIQIFMKTIFSE